MCKFNIYFGIDRPKIVERTSLADQRVKNQPSVQVPVSQMGHLTQAPGRQKEKVPCGRAGAGSAAPDPQGQAYGRTSEGDQAQGQCMWASKSLGSCYRISLWDPKDQCDADSRGRPRVWHGGSVVLAVSQLR